MRQWQAVHHALAALRLLAVMLVRAQEGVQLDTETAAVMDLAHSIENLSGFLAAFPGGPARGWNSSGGVPLCYWTGVTCTDDGKIQRLTLQCFDCAVRATGTLPAALANLSAITTLDLSGHSFRGTLPQEWGAPGALPTLLNLLLNDNELTGTLPSSWGAPGAFPQLSLLRIDTNRLTGTLPTSWGSSDGAQDVQATSASLPSLVELRLANNRLAGQLPSTWGTAGAFPLLRVLALQNNTLTGPLPSWQEPTAMSDLEELSLQSNLLAGQLPAYWGGPDSWPALRYLYLHGNPLGGTLPSEWGSLGGLQSLRELGLNSTQLTGSLPPEWGSNMGFKSALSFWLQDNLLTGAIPSSWAQLTRLQRLFVRPGNPKLCGPVPPGLPFRVCSMQADDTCMRVEANMTKQECQLAGASAAQAPAAPAAEAPAAEAPAAEVPAAQAGVDPAVEATSTEAPAAPAGAGQPSSGGAGDGGVSAAVIAAPVAVGVALLLAAAVGGCYVAGKRRRRKEEKVKDSLPSEAAQDQPAWSSGDSHESLAGTAYVDLPSSNWSTTPAVGTEPSKVEPPPPPPGGIPLGRELSRSRSLFAASMSTSSGIPELPFASSLLSVSDYHIETDPAIGKPALLGSGHFGDVYRGKCGMEPAAIKVIKDPGGELDRPQLMHEVAILKACRSQYLVGFLGVHASEHEFVIVTDLLPGGNLYKAIQAGRISWYRRGLRIAVDVACALDYLHRRSIIHLDLKSPNVLLTETGRAKVADVGLARMVPATQSCLTSTPEVGTFPWAAPEQLLGQRCSTKADIFAYGVLLWEICTGRMPVRGQMRDIRVPEECPQAVADLVAACTSTQPEQRPTAEDIVNTLAPMGAPLVPARSEPLKSKASNVEHEPASQASGSSKDGSVSSPDVVGPAQQAAPATTAAVLYDSSQLPPSPFS